MGRISAEEDKGGAGWDEDLNRISANPSFSWDGAKALSQRQTGSHLCDFLLCQKCRASPLKTALSKLQL